MQSTLYWSFLILASVFLAYVSPFSLVPIVFLGGGVILGLGYLTYLYLQKRSSGTSDVQRRTIHAIGSVMVYVMVYWTTIGLFTNVRELREFTARYEPYMHEGARRGYTFYYVDHEGSYERIDSPELNALLADKRPERVRMILEVVRDFGRLRGYSVVSVESIPVDKSWTDGNPPWETLRSGPSSKGGPDSPVDGIDRGEDREGEGKQR
jgi:hypothetical protein